jgi:Protein of unknown function (DUF2924)
MRLDPAKAAAVEAEIVQLSGFDRDGLRARWKATTGRAAPSHLPKGLLLRMLAYRLQADVHGDLDPATVRFLDRILSDEKLKTGTLPLPDAEMVRPGTLLVREWAGTTHRVMALTDGFAWDGATYTSLSEVARAITGTRWNGPRFFGLRGRARA